MKEEPPSMSTRLNNPGFLDRIFKVFQQIHKKFSHHPSNKVEIISSLKDAHTKGIIEQGTLSMLEGALNVSTSKVRDIMIPKTQMVLVDSQELPSVFIPRIIDSSHSRYPVIDSEEDKIIGILLAKDLLPKFFIDKEKEYNLSQLMRPVVLIPESKKLNVLLDEFRMNRNHMAIVIDEYGEITGLVTIEDVLEEIVGEIEDETDDKIDSFIEHESQGSYMVSALIPIEEFNLEFGTEFSKENFDTLGGILMHNFGKIPKVNDSITIEGYSFFIASTEKRRIKKVKVIKAS